MAGSLLSLAQPWRTLSRCSWFFRRMLYRDYEVKQRHIQVLFATTFAASASMFELLLLTLADGLGPGARAAAWKLDFWALIALAYIMLPACAIWSALHSALEAPRRLAVACIAVGLPLFWYAIFQTGRLIHIDSVSFSADLLIARLGSLGITIVALLSGFGAVNFPYTSIHSFLQPVTQQQVAKVEARLLRLMKIIASRKRKLLHFQQEEARLAAASKLAGRSTEKWSCARRLVSWFLCGPLKLLTQVFAGENVDSAESNRVLTEVQALETFARELFIELDELVQMRLSELKARTLVGRLMNVLGWCCSAVCVYKISRSLCSLVAHGSTQGDDPATQLLQVLLIYLRVPLDVSYWVPVLSLSFVGYLAFANTRQFILRVFTVFRLMSTSVTSNFLALLMSEVMAMYFAACVLLTLRFVPRKDRADLLAMVGEVDLSYVHLHFDYVFFLSSLCTAVMFSISSWSNVHRGADSPHFD
eukprot:NODE_4293_length_1909_cov_6.774411.p1 GENE.NODE_4293_length_1909_cov_6.774411~~NODE_4293_length_1909_cov_6.774411.p1  ORF type:complete len:475 (-),score=118.81 NODE_4293_length_1909_cov_6.774411:307-1731(-)